MDTKYLHLALEELFSKNPEMKRCPAGELPLSQVSALMGRAQDLKAADLEERS